MIIFLPVFFFTGVIVLGVLEYLLFLSDGIFLHSFAAVLSSVAFSIRTESWNVHLRNGTTEKCMN